MTNKFPTLVIEPHLLRHDGDGDFRRRLESEIKEYWGKFVYQYKDPDDEFSVYVCPSAAPHTVPATGSDQPTHQICWWFGPNGQRLDMLGLSSILPADREPIIEKIAQGITAAVNHFREKFNIPGRQVPHWVKIYGLTGHATAEERREGISPARGTQSNEAGHINIAYIDEQATKLAKRVALSQTDRKPVTAREMLKQIDPVSEAILRRWEIVVRPMMRELRRRLAEQLRKDEPFEYDISFDHKVDRGKLTGPEVRFADLVKLEFKEPISLSQAYLIITEFYSWFGGLYKRLWSLYENYWQADKQQKSQIIEDATDTLLEEFINAGGHNEREGDYNERENIRSLLIDIVRLLPSYGQLKRWLNQRGLPEQVRSKLTARLER